jgi:hypothetical protein
LIEVLKEADSKAFCIVRARGADGADVGRDVAAVEPVGGSKARVSDRFLLTTSRRPVTGEVAGCSAAPIVRDDEHEG